MSSNLDNSTNWESYASHAYFYDSIIPNRLHLLLESKSQTIHSFADIGCGDGSLLLALRQAGWFHQRTTYGIDISNTRLNRIKSLAPEVHTLQSSAEQIPLESEMFDLLISTQVIEHVPDQQKMIQELHRLLKPGGSLYLSTVFKHPYAWYFYRCNGHWAIDPTHIREYTSDSELLPAMEQAGFKIQFNEKEPIRYPLVDPIFRRLGIYRHEKGITAKLRQIKLRIPGYYNWEIIANK